jgi:hypothetical protein
MKIDGGGARADRDMHAPLKENKFTQLFVHADERKMQDSFICFIF